MDLKRARKFVAGGYALAWLFDLLFWERHFGVNFPVFTTLLIFVSVVALWRLGTRPAPATAMLLVVALLLSWIMVVREEPFTRFLSLVSPATFLVIAAGSYRNGDWWRFGFREQILQTFRLGLGSLTAQVVEVGKLKAASNETSTQGREMLSSLVRGLLLSAPVLLVFGVLLASADPIFASLMESILGWLKIENLPEYVFRLLYISFGGFLLGGVLFFVLTSRDQRAIQGNSGTEPYRVLGLIEANTLLTLLNLMLLSFIIIQIRYFFGGQANISVSGYTYAEYARRGFFELVVVSILGLGLLIGLSSVLKQDQGKRRTFFTVGSAILVSMLVIILISSFQRLLLYETAYGFTRLRIYTHVFIVWLGCLLLAFAVLQSSRKLNFFPLAILVVAIGYVSSLAGISVDKTIVRENLQRLSGSADFDFSYLMTLSVDAVPEMVLQYELGHPRRDELAAALACHAVIHDEYKPVQNWLEFSVSGQVARQSWLRLVQSGELSQETFADEEREGWYYTLVDGKQVSCNPYTYMD